MARVRITSADGRKFVNFTPTDAPQLTVRYKDGHAYTVKESWATQLEYLGKAVRVETPPRPPGPRQFPAAPRARRARTRSKAPA